MHIGQDSPSPHPPFTGLFHGGTSRGKLGPVRVAGKSERSEKLFEIWKLPFFSPATKNQLSIQTMQQDDSGGGPSSSIDSQAEKGSAVTNENGSNASKPSNEKDRVLKRGDLVRIIGR